MQILDARRRAASKKMKKLALRNTEDEEEEEDDEDDDEDDGGSPFKAARPGGRRGATSAQHGRVSITLGRIRRRLRLGIRRVIKTQTFYWIIIMLVFFNTACVAVEHAGQPDWLTNFLRE